jgi:hypothetical protein
MTLNDEVKGRDAIVIEQLLRELDELRELDRRRNAHAPGSAAHDAATLEVDLRTRRLMDRFRDLQERHSSTDMPVRANALRPVDPRDRWLQDRGSLLN